MAEDTCDLLPYVRWDRLCIAPECLTVFGWIKRPDAHEDFVTIFVYSNGKETEYMTSSKKYSLDIFKRLNNGSGRGHRNCKRVEHELKVKNPIKL